LPQPSDRSVYLLLAEISAATLRAQDPQELYDAACRIAVEFGGFLAAWIGVVEGASGAIRVVASAGRVEAYLARLEVSTSTARTGQGPFGKAVRENRVAVCNDIERSAEFAPWREPALAEGYRAAAAFPLRRSGAVFGGFTQYSATPGFFDAEEVRLLERMAADMSIASELLAQRRATRERERLFEMSHDLLAVSDFGGRFLQVNPAWTRCLGWTRDELIGRRSLDFVHPDDLEASHGRRRRLVAGAQSVDFQNRYRCKDGSYRWLSWNSSPAPDAGQIFSVIRDVTQQRERDGHLRLLEACIGRMNDIVLITEADPSAEPWPRIVFVNDAFVARSGYSREEVLGRTPRILQGPKTERRELDRIAAALARREPVFATLTNYAKDGREFIIEVDIVPVMDEEQHCTHFVAVERDITQRIALEERLRRSERMEAVGQLTGGIAHDFNNLLTVININEGLLRERLPPGSEQFLLTESIGRAAQRGTELTSRLLAFARRQPLDSRVVDLNELIASLRPLLERSLGAQIELQIDYRSGPCIALIDPGQLENALLNLCVNARDAVAGAGRVSITTVAVELDAAFVARDVDWTAGAYWLLTVSDTGSGMSPEILPHVFEPFFTTKSPGRGTGLGLAMVFGFVKQSGGHVEVHSEQGRGTTVRLYLPRVDVPVARPPLRIEEGGVPGGEERLLLVEDDPDLRENAAELLCSLGYTVTTAADGPAALARLRSGQDVDLLFTDFVMPGGLNGRELAAAASQLRPGLKVLYTSGYTEDAIFRGDRLDPSLVLIPKPYRKSDLARALRRALAADQPAPNRHSST
jgi:PAS domain S-box-containing protein